MHGLTVSESEAEAREQSTEMMSATPSPVGNSQSPTPRAILTAWPRSAQTAIALLLGFATFVIAVRSLGHFADALRPSQPPSREGVAYQIDLNTAQRAELLQLPAIGESLAQRIVDYRQEHGPFARVDDLRRVRGIGPLTMEKLRPWICASQPEQWAIDDQAEFGLMCVAVARRSSEVVHENSAASRKLT